MAAVPCCSVQTISAIKFTNIDNHYCASFLFTENCLGGAMRYWNAAANGYFTGGRRVWDGIGQGATFGVSNSSCVGDRSDGVSNCSGAVCERVTLPCGASMREGQTNHRTIKTSCPGRANYTPLPHPCTHNPKPRFACGCCVPLCLSTLPT